MAEPDRITESARHAIVDILNRIVPTEYSFVMNYPRIIDQIVTIEGVADQQLVTDLEHLAKQSIEHIGIIGQLATRLGGETASPVNAVIERIVDMENLGEQQLAGEKAAMALYLEAKQLAEDNPVKSTGFGEKLRSAFGAKPDDAAPRGETIRLLEHLASQERTHVRIIEDSLATYLAMRKPRD